VLASWIDPWAIKHFGKSLQRFNGVDECGQSSWETSLRSQCKYHGRAGGYFMDRVGIWPTFMDTDSARND
jgi:hypothetical protein